MISRVCKVCGRAGIDNAVSDQWDRISAIRSVPVIDGLLGASALTHDLTLVTRKDRDVAGLGAAKRPVPTSTTTFNNRAPRNGKQFPKAAATPEHPVF